MKLQLTLFFLPLLTAISKLMAAPSFCLQAKARYVKFTFGELLIKSKLNQNFNISK
jgi:hypothetical protein